MAQFLFVVSWVRNRERFLLIITKTHYKENNTARDLFFQRTQLEVTHAANTTSYGLSGCLYAWSDEGNADIWTVVLYRTQTWCGLASCGNADNCGSKTGTGNSSELLRWSSQNGRNLKEKTISEVSSFSNVFAEICRNKKENDALLCKMIRRR